MGDVPHAAGQLQPDCDPTSYHWTQPDGLDETRPLENAHSASRDGLNDTGRHGNCVTTDQKDGACRKRQGRVLPGVAAKSKEGTIKTVILGTLTRLATAFI